MDVVTLVREREPVLLAVDPLFRLVRVQDGNSYAETYAVLGPLIDVARETGTHILCLHHSSKMAKADAIDAPIGSIGLSGAAGTVLVMRRAKCYRTLQTVQRIGPDLPETVLSFDPGTRRLSVGGTRAEADLDEVGKEIVEYLRSSGEKTEPEIVEHTEGRTAIKRDALRSLVKRGIVSRGGTGKKNDAFRYLFACTQPIAGTREQNPQLVTKPP